MQIETILVPVDFSSHAAQALDHAVGLAKIFDAHVHLLHCYPLTPGSISPYGPIITAEFTQAAQEAATAKLHEWRDKVATEGVEIDEHVTSHFPSEAIARTATEVGADLIVMGTRGLTGLKHVLLGSIAERTIRIAPCPVLTVKAD